MYAKTKAQRVQKSLIKVYLRSFVTTEMSDYGFNWARLGILWLKKKQQQQKTQFLSCWPLNVDRKGESLFIYSLTEPSW